MAWNLPRFRKNQNSKIMKKSWIPVTGLLMLLVACGTPVRIYTDSDPLAAFDTYSTYNFLDFTEGNKKTIPGMELERIRVAVAREFERYGFTFSENNPDVSVQITVYHREAVQGNYYRPYGYHYMERALAVDMYDNLNKKHVWHGAAVGELVYDSEQRAQKLPEIVSQIFEKYPVVLASAPTPGDSIP